MESTCEKWANKTFVEHSPRNLLQNQNPIDEEDSYGFEEFLENFCVFEDDDRQSEVDDQQTEIVAESFESVKEEPLSDQDNGIKIEEETILQYDICTTEFADSLSLKQHRAQHETPKRYKCQYCPKLFAGYGQRKTHERIHTGAKPYDCPFCQRKFSQKSSCNRHKNTCKASSRRESIPNNSIVNEVVAMGKQDIKLETECHISSESIDSELNGRISEGNSFICELCYTSFSSKTNLDRHRRTHSGEKPFKCRYCSMSFGMIQYRTKHERIHTGEKPFKCPHCEYRSTDKSSVNRHLKRDVCSSQLALKSANINTTPIQPSEHQFTPKSEDEGTLKDSDTVFCQPSHTENQQNVTSRKKRFECEFCGKILPLNAELEKHRRTHTGEKPYKCQYCSMSFAINHYRVKHERIHTGERPYKCPHCPYRSKDKSSVNRHLKTKVCLKYSNGRQQAESQEMTASFNEHADDVSKLDEQLFEDECLSFDLAEIQTNDDFDPLSTAFEQKFIPKQESYDYDIDVQFEDVVVDQSTDFNEAEVIAIGDVVVKTEMFDSFDVHMQSAPQNTKDEELCAMQIPNASQSTANESKTHVCNICSKRFSKKSLLVCHERNHTGERPFQCDICSKRFTSKQYLTLHMQTHTTDKNFPCKQCDKVFKYGSSRFRHQVMEHGRIIFESRKKPRT